MARTMLDGTDVHRGLQHVNKDVRDELSQRSRGVQERRFVDWTVEFSALDLPTTVEFTT